MVLFDAKGTQCATDWDIRRWRLERGHYVGMYVGHGGRLRLTQTNCASCDHG